MFYCAFHVAAAIKCLRHIKKFTLRVLKCLYSKFEFRFDVGDATFSISVYYVGHIGSPFQLRKFQMS